MDITSQIISHGQDQIRAEPKGVASPTVDFETFVKMLTTQLKNQDPLDPMDSANFASQLAAFSSVEQQVLTNDRLETIKNQLASSGLLSHSEWVGKFAKVPGPAYFSGTPLDIAVSVPKDAETADIVIKDEEGSVIFRERISKERSEYRWKGESNSGETVKNGNYIVFVETFKKGASQGLMDMEAYQKIKEVQLEDGKYSIIFASGLEVDPDSISAVRD